VTPSRRPEPVGALRVEVTVIGIPVWISPIVAQ
jgi:hypothetical protein